MNCFPLRVIGCLILLTQASACAADQPASTTSSAPVCSEARALLETLSKQKIFTSTPEEFLQTTHEVLRVERDISNTLAPGMSTRTIELAPGKGWLDSGEIRYDMEGDKAVFDGVTFEFSKSCFSGPEQLLKLSANSFGKSYKENRTAPPEVTTNRTWYWSDPDVNYIRFADLYVGADLYHLKIERDPAPQEGD